MRLREEIDHQLAGDLGDEPHHRTAGSPTGSAASWRRRIISSRRPRPRPAPGSPSSPRPATRSRSSGTRSPGGTSPGSPSCRPAAAGTPGSRRPRSGATSLEREHGGRRSEVVNLLAFALRIQAAGVNRRLKQDMVDQDPSLEREALRGLSFFEPEPSDAAIARLRALRQRQVAAARLCDRAGHRPAERRRRLQPAERRRRSTWSARAWPGPSGRSPASTAERRSHGRRDGRPPEPHHGRLRRRPRARSAGSSTRGSSPAGAARDDS